MRITLKELQNQTRKTARKEYKVLYNRIIKAEKNQDWKKYIKLATKIIPTISYQKSLEKWREKLAKIKLIIATEDEKQAIGALLSFTNSTESKNDVKYDFLGSESDYEADNERSPSPKKPKSLLKFLTYKTNPLKFSLGLDTSDSEDGLDELLEESADSTDISPSWVETQPQSVSSILPTDNVMGNTEYSSNELEG